MFLGRWMYKNNIKNGPGPGAAGQLLESRVLVSNGHED